MKRTFIVITTLLSGAAAWADSIYVQAGGDVPTPPPESIFSWQNVSPATDGTYIAVDGAGDTLSVGTGTYGEMGPVVGAGGDTFLTNTGLYWTGDPENFAFSTPVSTVVLDVEAPPDSEGYYVGAWTVDDSGNTTGFGQATLGSQWGGTPEEISIQFSSPVTDFSFEVSELSTSNSVFEIGPVGMIVNSDPAGNSTPEPDTKFLASTGVLVLGIGVLGQRRRRPCVH